MIDKQLIKYKIEGYLNDKDTIVVLKGIRIDSIFEDRSVDMDELLANKLNYFIRIAEMPKKVITYDEYVALYEFVLAQYQKIVILENNVFFNFFPLYAKLAPEKLKALVDHFDEEKEGEQYEIGNITDLTAVYANVKLINNNYYVTYNNVISDEKEESHEIFAKDPDPLEIEEVPFSSSCYEILDEEDYLLMLEDLFHREEGVVYVSDKNTSLSKSLLVDRLKTLKTIFRAKLEIRLGFIPEKKEEAALRSEFTAILQKHWGHASFRKIKVYDTDFLERQEKRIKEISQGTIITHIVEEAEKCLRQADYRDVFVTAPTGAGKSAMFQIPAIYLAEKYDLFTIVISPLIGLMKDQVVNLELHNYDFARTINSDISPIQKQEIINDIADHQCHILYLSPESLLSKSDLEQIIGNRTLGLMVIDEAHIVTTWGKQFRPDYWYLGDHLQRIKKTQLKKKGMGFVIATFTATAIYGGIENMYEETIQSLKMVDPITYLGYVKREDIQIKIEKAETITGKTEYELNKFDQLIEKIDYALMLNQKILIYFPTVALINRFWEYCIFKNLSRFISRYHGQLTGYEKEENYQKFLSGETPIMLATKAFGMGIDIDDIAIVCHFSPTGNVCDYVQEIGRAARKPELEGEAYYRFMKNDFKHINRLHGLSVIKPYQLLQVIRKVYELYQENIRQNSGKRWTKKRNEMLVDAESFAHIFENPFFNEDDGINKVKTAMLLIQKDFERQFSFAPFHVRPIPLFETGFFRIELVLQEDIRSIYGPVLQELDPVKHICSLNLKEIWEQDFKSKYSFPRFKYMLYTKDPQFEFAFKERISPALCVTVNLQKNHQQTYKTVMNALKTLVNRSIREEKFYDIDGENGLVQEFLKCVPVNVYKAKSIIETLISAMSVYQRDYSKSLHGRVYTGKPLKSGEIKIKFMIGSAGFFRWIENGADQIFNHLVENTLYLVDETESKGFREKLLILGILEIFDVLVFKALGGRNSQIYIYVNQTKTMKEIIEKPSRYQNRLLELVTERHEISVEMLTYLFEGKFTNEDRWNLIEDYFLGIIPEPVIKSYEKKTGKTLGLR